jgi:hypothetical protein
MSEDCLYKLSSLSSVYDTKESSLDLSFFFFLILLEIRSAYYLYINVFLQLK